MPTTPTLVDREATHYVAVSAEVRVPFGEAIGPLMGEAAGYLDRTGVKEFGPAVFKYNVIDMPRLEVELGFVTPGPIVGNDRVRAGILPAGKYVTLTYFGHYDNLEKVTGTVIEWAREQGIEWDSTGGPNGEHFVSRFEIYPNGPMDEPDPNKWETQIWIKTKA